VARTGATAQQQTLHAITMQVLDRYSARRRWLLRSGRLRSSSRDHRSPQAKRHSALCRPNVLISKVPSVDGTPEARDSGTTSSGLSLPLRED